MDERINRNASVHPNGYVLLGLEWHPKMLMRAELTGVVINGYNTGIEGSRRPISAYEVDYWFGGLVATGVAPQPEGGSAPGPYDVDMGRWIRRYRFYGKCTHPVSSPPFPHSPHIPLAASLPSSVRHTSSSTVLHLKKLIGWCVRVYEHIV